jgi:sugar lactone lactonase YvrE
VAPGVNPITFSDDGRLFTALAFLGDALYELDPGLRDPPRLIAENLGMLNGFDFGPDGFLYSPVPFQSKIVRIDVDTGEITPVVAEGIMAPSVKFNSQGHLYAQNYLNSQIVRVDTVTGSMEAIATLPFGMDNLAFDSQDRLFCSEPGSGAIYEVLSDGTTRTVHSGGLIIAGSVAVLPRADGGESVYAADGWSLHEFDGATGQERGIYGVGCNPTSVSADGENLVLSSWLLGNAVKVWNPQTQATVEDHPDFARPVNTIRFQGDLIVADVEFEAGTARVVRISAADPSELVTLAEGLDVPLGLAATEDDLWLSDWGTGTVLQLVADGELLAPPAVVATGLARPEGLAVGPDGNLLVAETGAGRLSHIDLASGKVTALVEGLELGLPGSPAFPPAHIFTGVAVGASGTIYITSDVNNQLLAIRSVDPALVAHWKLDEIEGEIAFDSIGHNDAFLIGGPVWQPDDGRIGGALVFDGIDDYAFAQHGLNPADGPFSVFTWIKGGTPGQVILSQLNADNWLRADPDLGCVMTELIPPSVGRFVPQPLKSECVITDGEWHRIGFVWDGVNRALYVDDILVAEDTQQNLSSSLGGLNIGCGNNHAPGTFWSGLVDDVRIYNRVVAP